MAQTKVKYPGLIDFEIAAVDFLVIAGGGGGGGNGGTTGNNDAAGTDNTGGGGGGAAWPNSWLGYAGSPGGSGVVILRYPNTNTLTIPGGLTSSTTTVGSDKITTFTAGTGNIQIN